MPSQRPGDVSGRSESVGIMFSSTLRLSNPLSHPLPPLDRGNMAFRMANAPSGMGIAEHSKSTFLELRRRKVHRYVIFKIDEKSKEVVVEKTGAQGESYDDFTATMPENDYRYAVYDYDFVTEDNCQKSNFSLHGFRYRS